MPSHSSHMFVSACLERCHGVVSRLIFQPFAKLTAIRMIRNPGHHFVRLAPLIADAKYDVLARLGSELVAGPGMWHQRMAMQNSAGQLI